MAASRGSTDKRSIRQKSQSTVWENLDAGMATFGTARGSTGFWPNLHGFLSDTIGLIDVGLMPSDPGS